MRSPVPSLRPFRRLSRDRRGGAAVIFGFALLPMIAASGVAMDALLAMLARSEMAQAADAAALAGARAIQSADRDAQIRSLFAANFPQGRLDTAIEPIEIAVDADAGTVEVKATGKMRTRVMRLFGTSAIDLETTAVAQAGGEETGVEVALVLDVTGSMNDKGKIGALKVAAKDLLNILFKGEETLPHTYVSLVPFAGRVNVKTLLNPPPKTVVAQSIDRGFMAQPVPDGSGGANEYTQIVPLMQKKGMLPGHWKNLDPTFVNHWAGCPGVRSGANATDDSPPSEEKFPDFKPYGIAQAAWAFCPWTPIVPLTGSKSKLDQTIDGLIAFGNTRADIGLSWGWRAVSPNWRGFWADAAAPELPQDHGDKVEKIVVLMTDGMNTPEITDDPETKAQTEAQLAATCEAMKAKGIKIFTVLFQTPAELNPLYAACASGAGHFVAAASNEALKQAFKDIGAQIRNKYVRLAR